MYAWNMIIYSLHPWSYFPQHGLLPTHPCLQGCRAIHPPGHENPTSGCTIRLAIDYLTRLNSNFHQCFGLSLLITGTVDMSHHAQLENKVGIKLRSLAALQEYNHSKQGQGRWRSDCRRLELPATELRLFQGPDSARYLDCWGEGLWVKEM